MKTSPRFLFAILVIALAICLAGISLVHIPKPPVEKLKQNENQPVNAENLSDKTKTSIMEVISRREYDITDQHGILQSPNRKQQLRAVYKPGELKIEERTGGQDLFYLTIKNKGIYADKKLLYQPEEQAEIKKNENHLVIRHNGFSEEYINNESGIRQNFIIEKAPKSTKTITVSLETSGFEITDSGSNALSFSNKGNQNNTPVTLTYNDIKCWDSDGKILTASLHGSDSNMQIDVDVANAKFPVTIDPIIANGTPSNANKTMEIHQYYAWFGYSVATAGDVNRDGYSDVLVGAPKYDNGQTDEGAAFLFPGTANGLSLAGTILQVNEPGAEAGTSVSSAGDINGDGYSDVLVGAPYYGPTDAGAAFVYLGTPSGLSIWPSYQLDGKQANANFGISVAMAGDVNGNGFSDFLVGAHLHDNGQVNEGVAFLYYGAADGFGTSVPVILEANQANAMMGYAVAPAGDVDGDGYSDVMCSARLYSNGELYEGAVFVFKGSASGIVKANPLRIESNQVDARMGHSIAPAGDVNGDGYSDVIIGTYLYDNGQNNEGAAMIYHGSSSGLNTTPAITLEKNQTEAWFGWAVAAAGDVNGDGYADVIVGARYFDNGQANEGSAFVYEGSASGVAATPASTIESNQNDAWLGAAVAPAGDVNGDGYSDIIIGSYPFDNGQTDEGLTLVYHGSANGVGPKDAATVNGGYAYALLGKSLDGVGDVNGDGFNDIVVGAPNFDVLSGTGYVYIFYGSLTGINTGAPYVMTQEQPWMSYGHSVSGAGDVNGDGYDDVVVGSFTYSSEPNGTAYVYYGSATGINQATKDSVTTATGNSGFGFVVDGGSDLNGDGYADIVVGAPNHAVDDVVYGATHVFYGSSSGIGTSPKIFIGSEANAAFGVRVAMAGNVNGDNFDDLLIATNYSETGGKVFVYHGSATGVEDNPAITLSGTPPGLKIGFGIGKAGDVNADGFGDILIGAPAYNTSQKAVLVHYGSSSGITANNKTVITNTYDFGTGLASAGDVNGDGYSDIVVGARGYSPSVPIALPYAGAAFIYHGSVSGISTVPASTITGTTENESLGEVVACAGDVNGDGYSDILTGSPAFGDMFSPFSGRFQLFHGNNGKNLRNDFRLYNADLATYYSQNFTSPTSATSFGAGFFVKSFLGRNKGRLVLETRAPGTAFSRIVPYPITTSTNVEILQTLYTNLPPAGIEIKLWLNRQTPSTYVRTRVWYIPTLAITGQFFGPWRYLSDYVQGTSIAPPPVTSEVLRPLNYLKKQEETLAVYPNPVSEHIRVRGDATGIESLELISPDGKSVRKTPAGQQEMNVKGLITGTYLLIINQKGRTSTHKVLVK